VLAAQRPSTLRAMPNSQAVHSSSVVPRNRRRPARVREGLRGQVQRRLWVVSLAVRKIRIDRACAR
jgi:hypothetical protein